MYLDDSGGGGTPPPKSIMDSMASFASTAASGGFEVTERGGKDLIDVIDKFQAWIADRSEMIGYLEQERKLGTSNGAKVMAPYVQQVATDEQGFITQLRALDESLAKAKEGIAKAMENYRRTEEANQSNLKNIEI
jgi:hypothetical protein